MSEGRAFHAEGPACEKERSPNLDHSWGRAKLEEDVMLIWVWNENRLQLQFVQC